LSDFDLPSVYFVDETAGERPGNARGNYGKEGIYLLAVGVGDDIKCWVSVHGKHSSFYFFDLKSNFSNTLEKLIMRILTCFWFAQYKNAFNFVLKKVVKL
jgi:hypothetical protein